MEAPPKPTPTKTPAQAGRELLIAGAIIIALVVGLCAFMYNSGRSAQQAQPTANPFATPARSLAVGETGKLDDAGQDVLVASDEEAMAEAQRAGRNNDKGALTSLVAQGRIFLVPSGTLVKVVQLELTRTKIQVLQGNQSGKTGWVSMELVKWQ